MRKKYNKNIKVLFQFSLIPVIAEKPITVTIKGKFFPEKKIGGILYFKNRTESKLCIREVKSQRVDDCKTTELISVPDKYSGQNVASFLLSDSRFFYLSGR